MEGHGKDLCLLTQMMLRNDCNPMKINTTLSHQTHDSVHYRTISSSHTQCTTGGRQSHMQQRTAALKNGAYHTEGQPQGIPFSILWMKDLMSDALHTACLPLTRPRYTIICANELPLMDKPHSDVEETQGRPPVSEPTHTMEDATRPDA